MRKAVIVGAGICGLSAAEVLVAHGWQVELIDKGQTAGGRFASRWFGNRERRIDIGAQFLSVRDDDFMTAVQRWEDQGLARHWCTGIPILTAAGLQSGEDGYPRWLGVGGMHRMTRRLATSFAVRQPATITTLSAGILEWRLSCVAGDAIRGTASGPPVELVTDAVILTQPTTQISHLLGASNLPLPNGLAAVRYDPCVAVVMDVPSATSALLQHPGAVRVEDAASPLSWVASAKGRGEVTAGDLLLLHARGDWSAAHQELTTAQLTDQLLADSMPTLRRLGITRDLHHANGEARLWRYSRCVAPHSAPYLRLPNLPPLYLAGDGFGDCPRVEGAWLSGRRAAMALLAER